jgi:hypothetical protein
MSRRRRPTPSDARLAIRKELLRHLTPGELDRVLGADATERVPTTCAGNGQCSRVASVVPD